MRLGYLNGYDDGTTAVIALQKIDIAVKANAKLLRFKPNGIRIGEIVKALNGFYENPLNLRISIWVPLTVVAREASGDSKESVDAYIRGSRAIAAGEFK